ncbi:hypothetical protein E4N62_36685 [Streptomyces sp. MNU76]|uniref:hypothetical protein n=1 Tax=Streptomyces sp. MNU76 TaxID=2560026 RepID=UPI001E50DE93|nr:hypothetical protein [Streptomyces sp. MNU76]MCC9710311.1 hypothetical protein [Streptomyces sp. MNU76]
MVHGGWPRGPEDGGRLIHRRPRLGSAIAAHSPTRTTRATFVVTRGWPLWGYRVVGGFRPVTGRPASTESGSGLVTGELMHVVGGFRLVIGNGVGGFRLTVGRSTNAVGGLRRVACGRVLLVASGLPYVVVGADMSSVAASHGTGLGARSLRRIGLPSGIGSLRGALGVPRVGSGRRVGLCRCGGTGGRGGASLARVSVTTLVLVRLVRLVLRGGA